eukprot:6173271-Pleurochrysis_carterae.AAC.1
MASTGLHIAFRAKEESRRRRDKLRKNQVDMCMVRIINLPLYILGILGSASTPPCRYNTIITVYTRMGIKRFRGYRFLGSYRCAAY